MALLDLRPHNRYDYSPLPDRPKFTWPDGKRLAFYICNNSEVFSFCEGLGGDSAVLGAPQTSRNYAWRDYGNRVGQWYLFDLLDELGLPSASNFNALLFETCPQIADRMMLRGDEFVGHGRTNAERQDVLPVAEERALIEQARDAIQAYTGSVPRGWMGPWLAESLETPDLLKEAGFDYVMDWPADDQPFWMTTRSGPILSVPYSIEINDSPVMSSRQQSHTDFESMIVDQFDEMLAQSQKYPLVCSVVLHSFVIGQPYRLRALRRALQHVLAHCDDVWITTPGKIAEHYSGLSSARSVSE
jgi:allantoinase